MGLSAKICRSQPFAIQSELQCRPGEVLAIVGPSGSGKTTILRSIAGLQKPDQGIISCAGQIWFDSERAINLSPQQRKVGFVFQDFALFAHMTVLDNVLTAMSEQCAERHRKYGCMICHRSSMA